MTSTVAAPTEPAPQSPLGRLRASIEDRFDDGEEPVEPEPTAPGAAGRLKAVALAVKAEAKEDNVPVASAGIAFFGFVALIPALTAVLSIYGLVSDPEEIAAQITDATKGLPQEISDLLAAQMERIASTSNGALGAGVVIGILFALFSASAAIKQLIATLNVIYDLPETRSPLVQRLLAYSFTIAAALFVVVAGGVFAALPGILGALDLGTAGRWLLNSLRFPVLALAMAMALAVLYHVGPNHEGQRFRWVTTGSVTATVLWVVVSGLFSFYTANFASYNETYGTLGAIVILLMWLYLTAAVVLLGAEIDAVLASMEAARHAPTQAPVLRQDGATTQLGKAALGGVAVGVALGVILRR